MLDHHAVNINVKYVGHSGVTSQSPRAHHVVRNLINAHIEHTHDIVFIKRSPVVQQSLKSVLALRFSSHSRGRFVFGFTRVYYLSEQNGLAINSKRVAYAQPIHSQYTISLFLIINTERSRFARQA